MKQEKAFKEYFKEWRLARSYTQYDAADVMERVAKRNVSHPTIQRIEGGAQPLEWFVIAFANISQQDVNMLLRAAGLPVIEKEALPTS